MTVEVRDRGARFHTQVDWLDSWHSFSFGPHFDPANTGHGLLLVLNDDVIAPGTGFPTHPHRDMEIVTWVLDGELEHRDSTGTVGRIYPGLAQRMSAGRGIRHSEANASRDEPLHLVQMWVPPDTEGLDPSYEEGDVREALGAGGLVPVASGRGHDGAVTIHQRDAVLWAGRLQPAEAVTLPGAPHVHLYVARGSATLEGGGALGTGDAARFTAEAGRRLEAGADGAEVLVWETA